jgi:hypothetical protein
MEPQKCARYSKLLDAEVLEEIFMEEGSDEELEELNEFNELHEHVSSSSGNVDKSDRMVNSYGIIRKT